MASNPLPTINMRVPFKRRVGQGSKTYLFYVAEQPSYLPASGGKILIHHLNVPEGTNQLRTVIEAQSTNVAVVTFGRFDLISNMGVPGSTNTDTSQPPAPWAITDGFTYAFQATYVDGDFGYASSNCDGVMEYGVSPSAYAVYSAISSNEIVTERVAYDDSDGVSELYGTTTGASQGSPYITPMLFVGRDTANTVFTNLYKSFNLPITSVEEQEFTQTTIGYWIPNSATGTVYYNGHNGDWYAGTPSSGQTTAIVMTHPVTGYTGMFYDTVYEYLNQDNILVMEIPQTQYGEIIDGKTLKLSLPGTGSTGDFYEIYGAYKKNTTEYEALKMDNYLSEHDFSASYFGTQPDLNSAIYESNVALLFCDDILKPGGTGSTKSWETGHDQVMLGEKVYNPNSTTKKEFFDFYEDKCVGIAYLDRGFAVITDPEIYADVHGQFEDSSYSNIGTAANIIMKESSPGVIDWNNSQFLFTTTYVTGTTTFAEFLSYNTEKSMNILCIANTNEFYKTTNMTAKVLANVADEDYADFKTGTSTTYPIVVTEIGLHDAQGNLLAIVKPTEPVKKYWYDIVAFTIKIRL